MRKHKLERGSVAIEFALIFGLFMALLYAIISYGFAFTMVQSFTYAAEEGLRAAVRVNCTGLTPVECESDLITPTIKGQVANTLSWLPETIFEVAVGTNGENVEVFCNEVNGICDVTIHYNNAATPIIPNLRLPVVGEVPKLPSQLVGRARLRI